MPTITIAFRGLLVLNEVEGRERSMEIGILEERHHHVPRIMTFRNGVREDTLLLDLDGAPEIWTLVVDDPVRTGITRRESGNFDRLAGVGNEDDFRWIINLENNEFPYGNIAQNYELDRSELKRVVQVTSGEFYTRLKSSPLRRSENGGTPTDFGAIGGVMGLDIQVNSGGAGLVDSNGDEIFRFRSDANVMYEFANAPSDTDTRPVDHFPHYYEIFERQPGRKFGFERRPAGGGTGPGPNPALCGKIYLGEFGGSLESVMHGSSGSSSSTEEHHSHE